MGSGSCSSLKALPADGRAILAGARRAVLATVDPAGRPHAVPICFAVHEGAVVSALDHKPKRGRSLRRVANLLARPDVAVLVDHWDEDWTRLGWVMIRGRARLAAPGTGRAALESRYPQYERHPPEGQVISVDPHEILWWTWR